MSINKTELYNKLEFTIREDFLPVIISDLNSHRSYLKSIKSFYTEYNDLTTILNESNKLSVIEELIELNSKIQQKLKGKYKTVNLSHFDDQFSGFINSLNQLIADTPEFVEETQTKERFQTQKDDSTYIKILKFIKRCLFGLDQLPIITKNLFLKLFKKPLLNKKIWKQKIPYRNLTALHFKVKLSRQLTSIIRELNLLKSKSLYETWNLYEGYEKKLQDKLNYFYDGKDHKIEENLVDQNEYANITELISSFENDAAINSSNLLQTLVDEFVDLYSKAATIEYPKSKFSEKVIESDFQTFQDSFITLKQNWNNTLFALVDDWGLNNDIYIARYQMIQNHLKVSFEVEAGLSKIIETEAGKILTIFDHVKTSIDNIPEKSERIYEVLLEQKVYLDIKLRQRLVPRIIQLLVEQDLPTHLSEIETSILKVIDKIDSERILVKDNLFNRALKNSELYKFSPHELLLFTGMPQFKSAANILKKDLTLKIYNLQKLVNETEYVASFSLDSAIALLEGKKGNSEEAKTVLLEGLERSVKKYNEIVKEIKNLSLPFTVEIKDSISELNNELENLTKADAIFELRLKLTKAKAVERSKELRLKTVKSIRNFFPKLFSSGGRGVLKSKNLYNFIRSKLGFTPKKDSIQSEISDFLAETKTAVSRLPFVYQRLFVAEPLTDDKFFFGRVDEIQSINNAYSNWEKSKYASTIIIGEKGSGSTTLINFYLKQFNSPLSVIRKQIDKTIFTQKDLVEFFTDLLDNKGLGNKDDVIKFLNGSDEKQVIVLENIQHLYLRKIDGFSALKTLFEIISKTNKNVFWLSNCSVYAWNYLCKTININDYWGYIIKIKDFSDEDIIEMVLKRHRISGYDIDFLPTEEIKGSKSYKKISSSEQQKFLEKEYCTNLNEFAQSNLSLALLFWLRSTAAVEKDVIKIGTIPDFDYSFISNLSNDKIFTLSSLLLHDGLTVENLSLIFQYPIEKCKLVILLMLDDGLIVEKENTYLINPLLYRQIVRTLRSKNIIH